MFLALWPNEHLNTMGPELISRDRCIHVRTGDLDSHALENQTQRTHRDAPNAHQVHLLSRGQKCNGFYDYEQPYRNSLLYNQFLVQFPII